jgi:ABC-type uncharacterized transport system substrate-binding protein
MSKPRRTFVKATLALPFLLNLSYVKSTTTTTQKQIQTIYYLDESTSESKDRFARLSQQFESLRRIYKFKLSLVETVLDDPARTALDFWKRVDSEKEQNFAVIAPNSGTVEGLFLSRKSKSWKQPIFFALHSDPIRLGLANSLITPGRDATGFTFEYPSHFKLLECAMLVRKKLTEVGLLTDDFLENEMSLARDLETHARSKGIRVKKVNIEREDDSTRSKVKKALDSSVKTWIVPATLGAERRDFEIVRRFTDAGCAVIANTSAALAGDALVTVVPKFEAPYSIWARQFEMMLSGIDINEIPIEQPSTFQRGFNLDVAKRLNIKLSRAQLASFDVLYSARNKLS